MNRKPPHILWLLSDQHNAGCLGSMGHPDVRTPHLDRLAAEGIRYENAFCNNPICAPSRICFLTGQHVHRHGVSGNSVFEFTGSDPLTLPLHFRRHGYQTALIGKGHLPRLWMERGFEHRRYCDLADADRNNPLSNHYFRYLVENGLGDDFDLGALPDSHPGSRQAGFVSTIPYEHSVETWTGDHALDFLRNRDTERPFFLHLSFQRPHEPLAPSPGKETLYDPATLTLPESARDFLENRFAGKPEFQVEYMRLPQGSGYPYRPRDEQDLKRQLAYYYSLVTVIDEHIGRVLQWLRDNGEDGNTVIVYHADHGDFAGEHGLVLKNLGLYESIHRIPLLLKYPDGPRNTALPQLVESVDLYPTLCHLAGLPIPDHVEGRTLPTATDEPGHSHVVCEWDSTVPGQARALAVRTADYRMVFYPDTPQEGELYDRANDPGEMRNLYREPGHDTVKKDLLGLLCAHMADVPRLHSPEDDRRLAAQGWSLTRLLHKKAVPWSRIEAILRPFLDSESSPAQPRSDPDPRSTDVP